MRFKALTTCPLLFSQMRQLYLLRCVPVSLLLLELLVSVTIFVCIQLQIEILAYFIFSVEICLIWTIFIHSQWVFVCIQTFSNYSKLDFEQIKIMRHLFIHIFPGNLITIIALLQHQKLRGHATTAFVLSLCISDLLFCSFSMPLTAVRYINKVKITF